MALSPMMTKYLETKEENKDCILFYRLGDFYEMFFEDALTASRELELTLTGKDCGLEERAPMCGVPYHSAEVYINKLVSKGYKVAIAEQVEDPKTAKGLVKREVVKIITPGTITNSSALAEDRNNFIMGVSYLSSNFGISIADISTGDFFISTVANLKQVYDEISRYNVSEIVCNPAFLMSGVDLDELKSKYSLIVSTIDEAYFEEERSSGLLKKHFGLKSLAGLGIETCTEGSISAGALLQYLYDTQKSALSQITDIKVYSNTDYMLVDINSRRNLELLETMREKKKTGSLLGVLDKTKTAMGARLLRTYIEQPLISKDEILKRQDSVEEFLNRYIDSEELCEYLNSVYDIERLLGKISSGTANTRDLLAFSGSLEILPAIKTGLSTFEAQLIKDICENLDTLEDIYSLIKNSINEDCPLGLKEGNILKTGYNEEVDRLRLASTEGKTWLLELEEKEKEKSGIKNLKIKYNKVFGYYFEVTNSFKDKVPDYFIRKQTLTNAERYTTEELKKLEDIVLGAQDKLNILEYELFIEIRDAIALHVTRIKKTARLIAVLDILLSFARVASRNNYVRPEINTKGILDIKEGRHPVVEQVLKEGFFISNDTYLDTGKNRLSIITGPNMAGKSTYMRQTALIVLMAQIGSFVPAAQADIGICDRLFTRVGASDDLASGQSTFMVEMTEVANILRNASKNSLIILDEIGRGTSTFDGLSIAWAVAEHISNQKLLGAKTLFATHYHELTELEGSLAGVNNYCIAVKEQGEDIVFLRKIVKGGADKSYGIQVAKLAGVPSTVLDRAKELLADLSDADIVNRAKEIAQNSGKKSYKPVKKQNELEAAQLSLFDTVKDTEIIEEIKSLDISSMTPIDTMNILYRLQNKIKNRI